MTTGKTIPLTRRTFVGKVMSLLYNMLSRLVIIVSLGSINAKKLLSDFPAFILALIFQAFLYSDQQTKDLKKKSPLTFLILCPLTSYPHFTQVFSDSRVTWGLSTCQPFLEPLSPLGPEICCRGLAQSLLCLDPPLSPCGALACAVLLACVCVSHSVMSDFLWPHGQ